MAPDDTAVALLDRGVEAGTRQRMLVQFPAAMALAPSWRASPAARIAMEVGGTRLLFPGSDIAAGEIDAAGAERLLAEGARLFPDVQFSIFHDRRLPEAPSARFWEPEGPVVMTGHSHADVMRQIRAPQAWEHSEGEGVTIAVVDTGICPTLPELPAERRSPVDPGGSFAGRHWEDEVGHGSMCAAVAASGAGAAGAYRGVAPRATVLAARSDLGMVDIASLYGQLIAARRDGRIPGRLVISNSWGFYTCKAPDASTHPLLETIRQAVLEGVVVVFAAGNNHHELQCHYQVDADGPNTIWGPNSLDEVIAVGTVNREETNRDPATPHRNSSRGPGEWAVRRTKPDCVAPTYGTVVWGNGRRHMDWWGTSGACPQVAGLAALILASAPALTPAQVTSVILESCREIPGGPMCVGRGMIDCEAAMRRLASS